VGARQVAANLGQPPSTLIVAGQGEFLAAPLLELLQWKVNAVVLSQKLGNQASRAAPAHALAVIAREAVSS